jgi:hypothetical protein
MRSYGGDERSYDEKLQSESIDLEWWNLLEFISFAILIEIAK